LRRPIHEGYQLGKGGEVLDLKHHRELTKQAGIKFLGLSSPTTKERRVIRRDSKANINSLSPGTSVAEFAVEVHMLPEALLEQLHKSGVNKQLEDPLTERDKHTLLKYLRHKRQPTKTVLQPVSVYQSHAEREELLKLIPHISKPWWWMDAHRWGSFTPSRRAELRLLVSDEFPEFANAYDWLWALGSGEKSDTYAGPAKETISAKSEAAPQKRYPPFEEGSGEGKAIPKSPEQLEQEEVLRRAEVEYLDPLDKAASQYVPEQRAQESSTYKPIGSANPKVSTGSTTQFQRDPAVKEWVLKEAQGICECCKKPAPFCFPDGTTYLEVHHVIPLSEGGPDTITNTVALCPNCHRELHHGRGRDVLVSRLYGAVSRLRR